MVRSTLVVVALVTAATGCRGSSPPEDATRTVTHTVTNTVTNDHTTTHTITEEGPQPGRFERTLVPLVKVFDDKGAVGGHGVLEDHMHVDEVRFREADDRLFYCSYTFGVIDVSEPNDAEYMAQGYDWPLESPVGRNTGCLHLDWDDDDPDIVYVTHRGNYDFHPHLSVVDLSTTYDPKDKLQEDPELDPVLAPSFFEDGISYEGLDAENGLVYVALHNEGIGVYQRDPLTNEMSRVGGEATLIPNAYDIEVVGTTAYVVDEQQGLFVLDVADPNDIQLVGQLFTGGVVRDLDVDGDHAFLAAGGLGLVVVDISDPSAPTMVSATSTGGTAVRLGYDSGRVAVAAWNDTRVFDVSDPASPRLIGATRNERNKDYADDPGNERPDITARTLGVDLHGDDLFVGNWMVPYTYAIHEDRLSPYMILPEDVFYMGIGTVEVGQVGSYALRVTNDGTAPLTITDAWATHPDFAVSPASVVVPAGGSTTLTVSYTAPSDEQASAIVNIVSDDPAQPLRKGYAVANPVGIGIGDAFPFTEGTDVNTLAAWTSDEMEGQVGLVAYFATF